VSRPRLAGYVLAEAEARLLLSAAASPADLAAMVERRTAGLALERFSAGPSSAASASPWTWVSSCSVGARSTRSGLAGDSPARRRAHGSI
jgi:hypothetical protein